MAPIINITTIAKPIAKLQIANPITFAVVAQATPTQNKIAQSWISEPISPIAKIYSGQIIQNITPNPKPIKKLQIATPITFAVVAQATPTQNKIAQSWISEPISPIAKTYSGQIIQNITPDPKPIATLQIANPVTFAVVAQATPTQNKIAQSWISEPISPIAKTYSGQIIQNITPDPKPIATLQIANPVTFAVVAQATQPKIK